MCNDDTISMCIDYTITVLPICINYYINIYRFILFLTSTRYKVINYY